MRPAEDALTALKGSGIDPAELRATYCQGGVRAALVWFSLHELAGLADVRNYAGSWEEWGNRPDTPIE
jgi:thiosulfate/3-mercaptopyruvate sulfurtransferase